VSAVKIKNMLIAMLSGLLVGLLCAVIAFFILGSTSRRVTWTKLASPPEQAVKILQFHNRDYCVLITHSGRAYFCNVSVCKLIDMNTGDTLAPCEQHIDGKDIEFRNPPSQSGQLVDACKTTTMEELPVTIMLLLYDDNSLWLGAYGYSSIPMYGAGLLFFCIFLIAGLVGFFITFAILSSRKNIKKPQDVGSTISA
jgi:hypothetical protein